MNPATPVMPVMPKADLAALARSSAREVARWTALAMGISLALRVIWGAA